MNIYHRARDRSLRKAEKHYKRAVHMQFMGDWLDKVDSLSDKIHADGERMHQEYKRLKKQHKKFEKEIKGLSDRISGLISN